MTREPIRSIQTGLTALGHEPGPVDGLFGNRTRQATERWLAAGGRAARTDPPAITPTLTPSRPGAVIHQGRPSDLWQKERVTADIVLASKLTSDGYVPSEIQITAIRDED